MPAGKLTSRSPLAVCRDQLCKGEQRTFDNQPANPIDYGYAPCDNRRVTNLEARRRVRSMLQAFVVSIRDVGWSLVASEVQL